MGQRSPQHLKKQLNNGAVFLLVVGAFVVVDVVMFVFLLLLLFFLLLVVFVRVAVDVLVVLAVLGCVCLEQFHQRFGGNPTFAEKSRS